MSNARMILDLFKLDGRVALVTGGSRGLGQAIAWGLAEAGADIVSLSSSGDDQETERLVTAAGRRFLSLRADLRDGDQRTGIAQRIVNEWGRVDILVNNAGSGTRHPPEAYPMAEWRDLLELHVTAAFDLAQQV